MISFLRKNIRKFNENTKKFYNGKYLKAWCSLLYCMIRFRCSFDDFYRYEFYKKSNYERNKFITYGRSKKLITKNNDRVVAEVFRNKEAFNKVFHDYCKRDYLIVETATQSEFEAFANKYGSIIMKPIRGSQGKGIFKIENGGGGAKSYNVEYYRDYLAEEFLIQHESLSSLNPTSVNTVRVLTFKGEIISCALRIGGAYSLVDNFSSGGYCGCVDIESGVVISPCINAEREKYIWHPNSHAKMIGFEIPNWEKVKKAVKEAANSISAVAYVGWDVAILADDVAIIEANEEPGHRIMQSVAQTGIYEKIKLILKNTKNDRKFQ